MAVAARVIRQSRMKMARMVATGLIFVAAGAAAMVWLPQDRSNPILWVGTVLFGAVTLLGLALMVHPQSVSLDAQGFTVHAGLSRRASRFSWDEVEGFHPIALGRRGSMVGFNLVAGARPQSPLSGFNETYGAQMGLPPSLPGKVEDLTRELNAYRARALSGQ